jgi:hypothetical protein
MHGEKSKRNVFYVADRRRSIDSDSLLGNAVTSVTPVTTYNAQLNALRVTAMPELEGTPSITVM